MRGITTFKGINPVLGFGLVAGVLLLAFLLIAPANTAHAAKGTIVIPSGTPDETYKDQAGRDCKVWNESLTFTTQCLNKDGTFTNTQTGGESTTQEHVDKDGNLVENSTGVGGGTLVTETDKETGEQTYSVPAAEAVANVVSNIYNCTMEGPIDCLIFTIGSVILGISTFFLGIAGVFFNLVVVKTVFQFSTIIGNSPGLLIAWSMLRDIGNMVLLFGFIFIGLATILDLHTYTAKKALPRLIIFAILMNFSLFAAEAVIDTSNVFSAVMYRQANTSPCVSLTGAVQGTGAEAGQEEIEKCAINGGISASIMKASGLSTMFKLPDGPNSVGKISFTAYIGLSLFALIGAIVMFAASIMLIIRAIILTALMVTAPLGFAGMAVPPLRKVGEQWWNYLIAQSFFAPAMLLMIFISLKIAEGFGSVGGGGLAGALTQPNASVMGVFLVFALVIGFLVMSLVAAKQFGAAGAGFAVKTAGGVTMGTMGFVGRRTVGRVSGRAAEGIRGSKWGHTEYGRRLANIADRGSKGSFDMRGMKGTGALSNKLGVGDLGKAQQGGYDKIVHDGQAAREKYAKSLKQTKEDEKEEKRLNQRKKVIEDNKEKVEENWEPKERILKEGINQEKQKKAASEKRRDSELEEQTRKLAAAAQAVREAPQGDLVGDSSVRNSLKAKMEAEQKAYDDLRTQHETEAAQEEKAIADAQAALETARTGHKRIVKGYDDEIKNINRRIAGGIDDDGHITVGVGSNSAKQRYANDLHSRNRRTIGAAGRARHHAYDAIKRDLKKTKADRLKDEIVEAVKNVGDNTHDVADKVDEAMKHANDDDHGKGGGKDAGGGEHH